MDKYIFVCCYFEEEKFDCTSVHLIFEEIKTKTVKIENDKNDRLLSQVDERFYIK